MQSGYSHEELVDAAAAAGFIPDFDPLPEPPQWEPELTEKPQGDKRQFGRLSLLSDRIKNRKPARWIISGLIPDKGLTFLHAQPKVGKSFVAIDWAVSIASGQDWQGYKTNKPGAVIYIAGEGNSAIDDRFQACCGNHGVQLDNLQLAISDNAYRLPKDKRELIIDVKSMAEHFGFQVSAVFFDTYRRTLVGDINSNEHAALWVAAADEIKAELDCAVVVVHHTLRGGDRMVGAQTLEASHDSLFYLTDGGVCANGLSKRVLLTHQDVKDGARVKPVGLLLEHTTLEGIPTGGDFDDSEPTTLVVVRDPDGVTHITKKARGKVSGKNQIAALTVLRTLCNHSRINVVDIDRPASQARVNRFEWQTTCIREGIADKPSKFLDRIQLPLVNAGAIKLLGEDVLPVDYE